MTSFSLDVSGLHDFEKTLRVLGAFFGQSVVKNLDFGLFSNLTKTTNMVELKSHKRSGRVYSKNDVFSRKFFDTLPKNLGQLYRLAVRLFDNSSVEEMEKLLLERALHDMNLNAPVSTVKLSEPSAKWRVISAMQKAIRRGDPDMAVKCALAMEWSDSKYLWRRLAIIGFEDGGIPMLPLTALICYLAGKEKYRQTLDNFGGRRILAYVVEQMALGVKDRTLCETCEAGKLLCAAAHKHILFDVGVEREFLLDVYKDPSQPINERYMCGLTLAGGLWRSVPDDDGEDKREYAPSDRKGLLAWLDSTSLPLMVKYCVRRGMSLGAESLPGALPLVWPEFEKNFYQASVVTPDLPEKVMMGKLPNYAFDGHTTEGKKAIAYFIKACKPVREWISESGVKDKSRFMKEAVFYAEGGLLCPYLSYPFSSSIVEKVREGEAFFNGISKEQVVEFYGLVRDNLSGLDKARRLIIEGVGS